MATLWEGTAKDQHGTHKRTSGQVREQDVNLWSWSTSRMLWPRRNPPMGKLLKAFIGDGPFCSSGVVWGMTFSRKDFMAGWWSDCCWDGGVCCFTNRFGSSWRDGCIICCCTLRGRPLKRQDDCEKLWRKVFTDTFIPLHFWIHFLLSRKVKNHYIPVNKTSGQTEDLINNLFHYSLIKAFRLSSYDGIDISWEQAKQGEGSDLPAGLAAAGSQKARFSDSAPFAAALTIAGGKIAKRSSVSRHHRLACPRVTVAEGPTKAWFHLVNAHMPCLI